MPHSLGSSGGFTMESPKSKIDGSTRKIWWLCCPVEIRVISDTPPAQRALWFSGFRMRVRFQLRRLPNFYGQASGLDGYQPPTTRAAEGAEVVYSQLRCKYRDLTPEVLIGSRVSQIVLGSPESAEKARRYSGIVVVGDHPR